MVNVPPPCPGPCDHTAAEHRHVFFYDVRCLCAPGPCGHAPAEHAAFAAGWAAAVAGKPRVTRLRISGRRDAWQWGWDAGASAAGKENHDATDL